MFRKKRSRHALSGYRGLETLEPRLLLAATVADPFDDLVVMNLQGTSIELAGHFADDQMDNADNTLIKFDSSMGPIFVELFDDTAPGTVANFLRYIDAGRYVDTVIHRSVSNFVVQGGGFTEKEAEPFLVESVTTFPAITNEPGISNIRGTIAMAKLGGSPNSATSQWFFNLGDNTGLNTGTARAITAIDTVTKTFTVAGDRRSEFPAGEPAVVEASTENNGTYTVVSSTLVSGTTRVVVTQPIPGSTLDGTLRGINPNGLDYQNGGFSVFAQVVGDGMTVVDEIAALPTFNKNTELGQTAFTDVPLDDYTNPDPVEHDNLVHFHTIARVDAITHTIVSGSVTNESIFDDANDDGEPDITIANGRLSLQFSGVPGTSQITIRGQSILGGPAVDETFTVRVSPASGQMGVLDENGNLVAVTVAGSGGVSITQSHDGEINGLPFGAIDSVNLVGSNEFSSLFITTKKGVRTEIAKLFISSSSAGTGSLFKLVAPRVDVTDQFLMGGAAHKIRLGNLEDARISILNSNGVPFDKIKLLRLDSVLEGSASISLPIQTLRMIEWQDDDVIVDTLTAPQIVNLLVTGNKKTAKAGDFEAGLTLSGSNVTTPVLSLADIRGSVTEAAWRFNGATVGIAKTIRVRGVMDSVDLRAARGVIKLSAARLIDSNIFAGVTTPTLDLPNALADFTATPVNSIPAFIGTLRLTGVTGSTEPNFVNSLVSARDLGFANLGRVKVGNDTTTHGFAAERIAGSISYISATTGLNVTVLASDITAGTFSHEEDFHIHLITA